jgi:GT2 family glycosyltransferase
MAKNNKVAVLLVLFNEELHIERLAKSIINQDYQDISVYAIDNNSSDSSALLLLKYLPDAHIINSKENLGFAKGNNLIAGEAINNNEELLFILNTDMELNTYCISNLVDIISNNNEIAGIGPIILYGTNEGRTNNIQCYVDKVNFTSARTSTLYTGMNIDFENLQGEIFVNTLHGGCFMIRSSVVSEMGLFCEDNFMYNDEIDLAYRINKHGRKLLVTKNAKAWHYHDWSLKNKEGYYLQYYYINRNRILFFYRYKKYLSIIREIIIDLFSLPVKIFWARKTAGLKLLKYYYLGYWHGLLNKKGKAEIEFR